MADRNIEDSVLFPGRVHVRPTPKKEDAAYNSLLEDSPAVGSVSAFREKTEINLDLKGDESNNLRAYLETLRSLVAIERSDEIPDSLLDTLDMLWENLTEAERTSLEGSKWHAACARERAK